MQSSSNNKGAFITSLMLGFAIIIGLLVIAIPSVQKTRQENYQKICIRNLALIEIAKERWALEAGLHNDAVITMDELVAHQKYLTRPVACPAVPMQKYNIGVLGEAPTCSQKGHQLPPMRKRLD